MGDEEIGQSVGGGDELEGVADMFADAERDAALNSLRTRVNEVAPNPDNPMEDPDTMKMYVAQSLGTRRNWDDMTPQQRLDAMTDAAGTAVGTAHPGLDAAYVPGALPQGVAGSTDPITGEVTVRPEEFDVASLDSDTVNTLYHESTHVEQIAVANEQYVGDAASLFNQVEGGTPQDPRAAQLQHEIIDNLGDLANPAPGTTAYVEANAGSGPAGYQAYRDLQIETEAHDAGDAAERMFQRVGAVHDELEQRMAGTRAQLDQEAQERSDALENLQNFQELPQDI